MTPSSASLLDRWWIYQKERFPMVGNSLLTLTFSAAAIGYSLVIRDASERSLPQILGLILLVFLTSFLLFLQLRIIAEFKDLKQDVLYHPHYPVPRGLITLEELQQIGLAGGLFQLGLALSLGWPMVLLLALLWGHLGLIAKDFFVPQWLDAHPLLAAVSHATILPLLAFYATAHDWLTVGDVPSMALVWFLLLSLLSGLTMAIGREIHVPKNEIPKNEAPKNEASLDKQVTLDKSNATFRSHRSAVIIWLLTVWLLVLVTLQASAQTGFVVAATVIIWSLLVGSVIAGWRFWAQPSVTTAKGLKLLSGLWSIGVYFNVGILPLLLRQ